MLVRALRFLLLLAVLFLDGCASLPFLKTAATATAQPSSLAPAQLAVVATETSSFTSTPVPVATDTVTITPTAGPFTIDLTPLPTETALPTLELPTEVKYPPNVALWDGVPTYLSESKPGYYFRLHFDPSIWALTFDQFGFPALGHRQIPGCFIAPASARGMPLNATVEHEVRKIGSISYQVSTAYVNGVKQFVNYAGGDGYIFTAFGVTFQDQVDQCLSDSETVLSDLRSVAVSFATPIATP